MFAEGDVRGTTSSVVTSQPDSEHKVAYTSAGQRELHVDGDVQMQAGSTS